jgi:hypothetical protein
VIVVGVNSTKYDQNMANDCCHSAMATGSTQDCLLNFSELDPLASQLDLAFGHSPKTLEAAVRAHSGEIPSSVNRSRWGGDEHLGCLLRAIEVAGGILMSSHDQLAHLANRENFEGIRVTGLIALGYNKARHRVKGDTDVSSGSISR